VKQIGSSNDGAVARTAPVFDPATGAQTAEVVLATVKDVDHAVTTAAEAFRTWRDTSLTARSRILFAFRELADKHRDDLARLITAEHGKVLEDARGEVARGIEVIEFACGRGSSVRTSRPGSTHRRSASRSAWWPESPRSTSR